MPPAYPGGVRALHLALLGLGALALLVVIGHRSGHQPPRDAVEAAQRELGIPLEAQRVKVGEVELFVVQAGPAGGPPVVLLHGFPEFWYAWKGAIAPLAAAGFRVVVPDQRGYDQSDKPAGVDSYRIDRLGDDVAGLIRALGFEKACVAAHDWGGGVAWNLAIRHPERVRKLAVIDTPHPQAARDVESKEQKISWYRTFFQIPWLPEEVARWGNWYVTAKLLRDTARPGAFPDAKLDLYRSAWDRDGAYGTMVDWYRAAYRFEPTDTRERRVSAPTLILLAPGDAFIPSDLTRASLRYLDDGRLVELPGGTHWVLQEDPGRVAAILAGFFAE